ncbi:Phox-like protein [Fomitiporia mediterranea MF3/22]|uniref:Phox-like protein n=1 Tax=Fomitiporia mediterranea (strain MF3/22) TaxID=694068 RepID=UPI0004409339|nr:Phox-like protein [Fomitiporia mediterranea MF3/22]EJD07219.1 Phox-like protein [Fomitiporia mediterranea MF3/22]
MSKRRSTEVRRLHTPSSLQAPLSSPVSPTDSDLPVTPASSSSSRTRFPREVVMGEGGSTLYRPGREEREERCYEYPLEHCTGLVEVIRDDEDRIDVEAEERAYRAFDLDESDSSALGLAMRNDRPRLLTAPARPPGQGVKPAPKPRAPSSIFSHDIWVGENGDAEKDVSFAKGVRIVGWTSVGDKRGGAYVVYDCAILTHALTTIHIHKRYSSFSSLHSTLLATLPGSVRHQVPPLPPRTAWQRFRPGFLEKRRKALQAWLGGVLLHPEIGGCGAVREWVMAG